MAAGPEDAFEVAPHPGPEEERTDYAQAALELATDFFEFLPDDAEILLGEGTA